MECQECIRDAIQYFEMFNIIPTNEDIEEYLYVEECFHQEKGE